ncbi:MAG: DUF1232 domain-containing protein [Anaerolineae bacterium]|nr:DUF1232 domain-containing protein [Anaerolineae bacterium]
MNDDLLEMPPSDPQQLVERLQTWFEAWSFRFSTWLGTRSQVEFEDIVTVVPDLVRLLINLLKENDLGEQAQMELVSAGEYVLNPHDLLPEFEMGVAGFLEDAIILSTPLLKLARQRPQLLRRHWKAPGDVIALLEQIEAKEVDILAYAERSSQEDADAE